MGRGENGEVAQSELTPRSLAYFHVAPAGARDDIRTNGLLPGDDYEEQEPGIYAWLELAAAQRCVGEFDRIREVPHDIWEITAVTPWTDDPLTTGVFSAGAIEPSSLALALEADWSEEDE